MLHPRTVSPSTHMEDQVSTTHVTARTQELPARPLAHRTGLLISLTVVAAVLLTALAFGAYTTPHFPWDVTIERAVQSFHPAWFVLLMHLVGEPGYPPQVYVLCAIILLALWFTGNRWEAVSEVFAIVGIGAVGLAVKLVVNRPRPSPDLVQVLNPHLDNGKFSFPAGHVESYMAILGFLFFLAWISRDHSWKRTLELVFFGLMMALIGLSRVFVGEHWPSDVLGGYLLGIFWLSVTILFYRWGKGRFFVGNKT